MNSYIIVNGQSSLPDKINAVNQISNATARQQWKTVLTKNKNMISRLETLVILNNRNASITFRFNVSAGNYDIYLKCIAPSLNTDTSTIRLDSSSPKILDLKRRSKQYISQSVNVLLFSNIALTNGTHTVSFGYREPMGLIRLTVRKKRSSLQIIIPAVDMLYKPEQAPVIQPAPVVAYEATTQGPIIEAEYKPISPTPTPESVFQPILTPESVFQPILTPESAAQPILTPETSATTTTTSEAPQIIIPPPVPLVSSYGTSEHPSVKTIIKPSEEVAPARKKKEKGFPWWAILLILIVLLALLFFLVYKFWKTDKTGTVADIDDGHRRLLQWTRKKLQNGTLEESERSTLISLKTALQSSSRNPEQKALVERMVNCRQQNTQMQKVLLRWAQQHQKDQTLQQPVRKQSGDLAEALKKSPVVRSQQQKAMIARMLTCRDNIKQQQLLSIAKQYSGDSTLQQSVRKRFNNLVEALEKPVGQRNQQQRKLVSLAMNCKQNKIVEALSTTPSDLSLVNYNYMTTRRQPQQTPRPQQIPQLQQPLAMTLRSSLTNKLIQEDKKRNLNILKDGFDQDELGSQIQALNRDKDIFQYIQKFDATSKNSQQQFPKIRQRLNQLLPTKKDNSLIEKILSQSLKRTKQQDTKKQKTGDFKKFLQVGKRQKLIQQNGEQNITGISTILEKAGMKKVKLTPSSPSVEPNAYQLQFGQNL